jgi:hypothetical protein
MPVHESELFLRLVQMLSRRQVFKVFEVLGAKGFRNHIRFAEPFAEVNELASFRAKGSERRGEPIAAFLATRTFYILRNAHCLARLI